MHRQQNASAASQRVAGAVPLLLYFSSFTVRQRARILFAIIIGAWPGRGVEIFDVIYAMCRVASFCAASSLLYVVSFAIRFLDV